MPIRPTILAFTLLIFLIAPSRCLGQKTPTWVAMDYGPYLSSSVEVEKGNIAYKGLLFRLDEGPGGVAKGSDFAVFDTDTLRWAGAWNGKGFIDWHGIAFDGAHNAHPKIIGTLLMSNPVAPGWGAPDTASFEDPRFRGRDGKAYGPLPKSWGKWEGLYVDKECCVLAYRVHDVQISERARSIKHETGTVFVRNLSVQATAKPLTLQVATASGNGVQLIPVKSAKDRDDASSAIAILETKQQHEVDVEGQIDLGSDFTIAGWIKTRTDIGTIVSKAAAEGVWVQKGKTFFVRGGRLGFDTGWVGAVSGRSKVADNMWHHVAVTYNGKDGRTRLFVDGKAEGEGRLLSDDGKDHVVRIGYTATNFMPPFKGKIDDLRIYSRTLRPEEIRADSNENSAVNPVAHWSFDNLDGAVVPNLAGASHEGRLVEASLAKGRRGKALRLLGDGHILISGKNPVKRKDDQDDQDRVVLAAIYRGDEGAEWVVDGNHLRLKIPAKKSPQWQKILMWRGKLSDLDTVLDLAEEDQEMSALDLHSALPCLKGGESRWPEKIVTQTKHSATDGPFSIETLTLPENNPWGAWMRIGGFDFIDASKAAVCTWQGDVWIVDGLDADGDPGSSKTLTWQRIATGLFQPLGLKVRDGEIFVLGRDQITRLKDFRGDGEVDFYECFNHDAQVTEHFHEFAMDLQCDDAGNFYYMKGARHAKVALVEQHGTLLKVSRDGSKTEILARGFRAPNGLLVEGDGTFYTTDQEGHWTPMNRINRVRPGSFHGNLMAYVDDKAEENHTPPLAWVHKGTDRSPSAPLRVSNPAWGALDGALLTLSYGTGKIFNVLSEEIAGTIQGGIVRLPVPQLPTGIHRGRFNSEDGQLYACGLFGWSSNKTRPGGFFRIRRTKVALDIPVAMATAPSGIALKFSNPLDPKSATDAMRYRVLRWNYKRRSSYGSRDWRISDGRIGRDPVFVSRAILSSDRRSVFLEIPDMRASMQMQIRYDLRSADGRSFADSFELSIHALNDEAAVRALGFDEPLKSPITQVHPAATRLAGLTRTLIDDAGGEEVSVSRMLTLQVKKGDAPSPFIGAAFTGGSWKGYLDIPRTGKYTFSAHVRGDIEITIDGTVALQGKTPRGESNAIAGLPLSLEFGRRAIAVAFKREDDSAAVLRAMWSGPGFLTETIPARAFSRNPKDTADIASSESLRRGRESFVVRGCTHCHAPENIELLAMPEAKRTFPDLRRAGDRLSRNWINRWLLAPHTVANDTTMPAFFDAEKENDRQAAADIATFLAMDGRKGPSRKTNESDRRAGADLFNKLGCIACHTFLGPEEVDAFERKSLAFVSAKYRPGALREFLKAPALNHAWTRMPDFGLSDDEAHALSAYIRSIASGRIVAADELDSASTERGRAAFAARSCFRCHENVLDKMPEGAPNAPSMHRIASNSESGCLSKDASSGHPIYTLDESEREALRAFVKTDGRSLDRHVPGMAAERAMRRLKCAACHDRDGIPSLRGTILAMEGADDDVAEIYPDLSWAGEKLRGSFLTRQLEGTLTKRSRPWLKGRMPAFRQYATTLAHGLAAQHGLILDNEDRPAFDGELARIGKTIAGIEGLNCHQCHGVGSESALASFESRGVNFSTVRDRLRPEFYHRWMHSPLRIDPYTQMPEFGKEGTTGATAFFDGNAERQFEAIWHYLESSPKPSRKLVKKWTLGDLAEDWQKVRGGRSFARGRDLFTSMSCSTCHTMQGKGERVGPDLSEVTKRHDRKSLLRELVDPSKVIAEGFANQLVWTNDGQLRSGVKLEEDAKTLTLVNDTASGAPPIRIQKDKIRRRRVSKLSKMPFGLVDFLTRDEILDLLAFLEAGGNPEHGNFKN